MATSLRPAGGWKNSLFSKNQTFDFPENRLVSRRGIEALSHQLVATWPKDHLGTRVPAVSGIVQVQPSTQWLRKLSKVSPTATDQFIADKSETESHQKTQRQSVFLIS